jgi:hypothetical protein
MDTLNKIKQKLVVIEKQSNKYYMTKDFAKCNECQHKCNELVEDAIAHAIKHNIKIPLGLPNGTSSAKRCPYSEITLNYPDTKMRPAAVAANACTAEAAAGQQHPQLHALSQPLAKQQGR